MVLSVEEYKGMSRLENFPSDDAIKKVIKEAEEDVNNHDYGDIYARGFDTLRRHFNRKRSNWRLPGRPILEASIPTC